MKAMAVREDFRVTDTEAVSMEVLGSPVAAHPVFSVNPLTLTLTPILHKFAFLLPVRL